MLTPRVFLSQANVSLVHDLTSSHFKMPLPELNERMHRYMQIHAPYLNRNMDPRTQIKLLNRHFCEWLVQQLLPPKPQSTQSVQHQMDHKHIPARIIQQPTYEHNIYEVYEDEEDKCTPLSDDEMCSKLSDLDQMDQMDEEDTANEEPEEFITEIIDDIDEDMIVDIKSNEPTRYQFSIIPKMPVTFSVIENYDGAERQNQILLEVDLISLIDDPKCTKYNEDLARKLNSSSINFVYSFKGDKMVQKRNAGKRGMASFEIRPVGICPTIMYVHDNTLKLGKIPDHVIVTVGKNEYPIPLNLPDLHYEGFIDDQGEVNVTCPEWPIIQVHENVIKTEKVEKEEIVMNALPVLTL